MSEGGVVIAQIDLPKVEALLPPNKPDASEVGVNYADAYLKALKKVVLEDGRKVRCKRRGLKITLNIDGKKGEGLLRRLEHGPDPRNMLREALLEAASNVGVTLVFDENNVVLVG